MATESCCREVKEDQVESPIHGDILEAILSHVPLIDLPPASHVSKSWEIALFSSLRLNKLKPWLLLHKQSTRPPYHHHTTHAYDPRSHVWIKIAQTAMIHHASALRSDQSNLLYVLSPSKLSFSSDPLHLTWHHAAAPLVWRSDPVVAVVGRRVVVAGGSCDFEDDPLAVEVYDIESSTWEQCDSIPANLKDSAAATWLSFASNDVKLFVKDKNSGVMHTFDPETKIWSGPYFIQPDPSIFYSVIAFSDDRLVLIGMIGDAENVKGVKLWGVNCDTFQCEEIGEMPVKLLEKLKGESFRVSSIGVCLAGNTLYVYNNPEMEEEMFVCEFAYGGGCRWRSVRNVVDQNRMERFVFTCSAVGIDDVDKAMMRLGKHRFSPLVLVG